MLTFNPSSSANGLVENIAATDEEKEEYFYCDLSEIPGVAALAAKTQELGSKYPAACVLYASEILVFTFKVILGLDTDKHSSKSGDVRWTCMLRGRSRKSGLPSFARPHLLYICCRVRNWP